MAFVMRLGGWRPVDLLQGEGSLRLADGSLIEGVSYRFEVWHQMVDGFAGPFRSEGAVEVAADSVDTAPVGRATLQLADGRSLAVSIDERGRLLAHGRPPVEEAGAAP